MGKKKKTINEIRNAFESEGYILLEHNYINNRQKLKFKCPKRHIHKISWNKWTQGRRCGKCFGKVKANINDITNALYNERYILLSDKYISYSNKLKCICNNGHITYVRWDKWKIGKRCMECYNNKRSEIINKGVVEFNLALYNTYSPQLNWCEETRRDPKDSKLLQVRCTESNCRKWLTPTRIQAKNRVRSTNSIDHGNNRFYCSDVCKNSCNIFNRVLYPKNYVKNYNYRTHQTEWRELILKRDNYECQRCGSKDSLIAHHIDPIILEPLLSADVDNGITLCKACNEKAHRDKGCRRIDLAKMSKC